MINTKGVEIFVYRNKLPQTIATNAKIDPTERSIPAFMMTKVTPIDIIPTNEASRRIEDKF